MPRTTRKIPGYCLHKSTGQARVTIRGRDFYLGRYDSDESRLEYTRVIQEYLAAGRKAPAPKASRVPQRPRRPGGKPVGSLSINEVIAEYWAHVQAYYVQDGRPTGSQNAVRSALRPLRRLNGHDLADEFGPVALKALRAELVEAGLSRNTVNARVTAIKRMFRWAVSEELVSPLVYQGLAAVDGLKMGRTEARETKPVRPVAPEQVAAVLPYVSKPIAAMIRLQEATGARPGEILPMKSGEVDRSGEIWIYRPTRHKTKYKGFTRTIPLGPRAQEILGPWLRDDPNAYIFRPADGLLGRIGKTQYNRPPARKPKKNDPNQLRSIDPRAGERYGHFAYYAAIMRACDLVYPHPELSKIAAKDLTPEQAKTLKAWRKAHRWHSNQLRHSFATKIRHQFGLEAAQVVLGHAKADTTQIYAERDLTKAVEVARVLG